MRSDLVLYCLTVAQNKHYENTPIQYNAILKAVKEYNFKMKNYDIFLIFVQNLDCGYTLEPPQ